MGSKIPGSRGFPRSLDLTVIALALVADEAIILFAPGSSPVPALSSQTASIYAASFALWVVLLVLGLLWRPKDPVPGAPGWGVKVYAVSTSLALFGVTVVIALPDLRSAGVPAFLGALLLVISASIFYVIGKSLWKASNAARLTEIALWGLIIVFEVGNFYFADRNPIILTPLALVWYMFRGHVKNVFSPPPPPEAANYVLRTRMESVKCSNCGTENQPTAEFCKKCKAPLASLTLAGAKPIGTTPSLMIPPEEELRRVEEKLSQLQEFRKSHNLLNIESYDGLIEMQKRRLEELRAMVPGGMPSKRS